MYASHPATCKDSATYIGCLGLYFLFEPYKNKELTNPFWATEMVSRGFHIWDIQHRYVRHAVAATPVNDYTMSYQVHEQFHSMAMGLVNWFLIWHRHKNGDPLRKWHACSPCRLNEDLQEDMHRRVRQQTRNNSVHANFAEFLLFLSRALQSLDSQLWLQENSLDPTFFPSGNCQSHKVETLGL